MSGRAGRAPAAITMRSAVMASPFASTWRGPTKRAVPSYTVTLGPSMRYWRPAAAMGSMRPKIRSRMAAQSAPSKRVATPSRGPDEASSASSAG